MVYVRMNIIYIYISTCIDMPPSMTPCLVKNPVALRFKEPLNCFQMTCCLYYKKWISVLGMVILRDYRNLWMTFPFRNHHLHFG